jgi:NAD(P)-dependent dehydrogenase (short-subunit alcohol dehydrogenase family)
MMGTLLLTGANSSLGLPAVEYLLKKHPSHTVILTVRNLSRDDPNTAKLHAIIARYPNTKTTISKLDLSSLEEVLTFATQLQEQVAQGKIPELAAIVCNAMNWSMGGAKYSEDGLELSMAVNHLSQLSLVLRLLKSMDTKSGRIVFLSSEAHYPKKARFEVYPPSIPQNLEEWVHPKEYKSGEEAGRGFWRYGVSKLAVVMGMYALSRRLKTVSLYQNEDMTIK